MSKSQWLKDQQGNFSNDKNDTFDPANRYVGIRLQQGVPLLDRDWNELEDIRRYETLMLRKMYVGNGTSDDGFRIMADDPPANNFRISKGRYLVEGYEAVNEPTGEYILYDDQEGVDPLSDVTEERMDTVYLDVWIEEITNLVNDDIGVETCVRHKLEWRVRVAEGSTEPPQKPDYHEYHVLAQITRPAAKQVIEDNDITDLRVKGVSLEALRRLIRLMRVPLLRQTLYGRCATVSVGAFPWGVAFDGTHIWVASTSANRVSKIDITTNKVTATVSVEAAPEGVAFDGTHIWVANFSANRVSKIDITTNAVTATVSVGAGPRGVAFDGTHIWVVSYVDSAVAKSVSKIDITTNAVTATVSVGAGSLGIAFDGTHIWVASAGTNSVSKIDITTNKVTETVPVGAHPQGIAFDGTHIWVASLYANSVSKIDITTNKVTATVSVGDPEGIAFDGTHIWVASTSANRVSKIDITINEVTATVSVGSHPRGIAFDGIHIWVSNSYDHTVSKILV